MYMFHDALVSFAERRVIYMENQHKLTILLVEDDKFACNEIESYIDQLDDVSLVGITDDSNTALDLVKYHVPDAIILDLELHEGGGNGLFFLSKLHDMGLEKLPYVLITTQNTSNVTLEAARQLGADFIITKYEKDYSAQKPVELLRMMRNAIQRHSAPNTTPTITPAEQNRKLTIRIHRELDAVGINPKAIGYEYLTEAIIIATKGNVPNLARQIALKYSKTQASVERAMQNAINRAWSSGNPDDLARNYTAVINYERGVPTLTEFVYHYASKFRNEL